MTDQFEREWQDPPTLPVLPDPSRAELAAALGVDPHPHVDLIALLRERLDVTEPWAVNGKTRVFTDPIEDPEVCGYGAECESCGEVAEDTAMDYDRACAWCTEHRCALEERVIMIASRVLNEVADPFFQAATIGKRVAALIVGRPA